MRKYTYLPVFGGKNTVVPQTKRHNLTDALYWATTYATARREPYVVRVMESGVACAPKYIVNPERSK